MQKEAVHLNDLKRILFGDAPPEFLIEIFSRTLIMYTLLLVIIRWLGKRMAGQMTIIEMSVMIMLGAVVSSPMQLPDKGILQSLTILLGIVMLQRFVTWLSVKDGKVEKITTGVAVVLVKDGILQLDNMSGSRISRQQVFAELRASEIYNLKQVNRMYIEGCGLFSIYKNESQTPGLSIFPPADSAIDKETKKRR